MLNFMESKGLMDANSIWYEADSSLDNGCSYPFLEPCLVANHRMMIFNQVQTPYIGDLIVIVMMQNRLENNTRGILTGRWIVGKSIINN